MEGLDTEVLEAARSYLQRNRAAFDADAGRAARRGSAARTGSRATGSGLDQIRKAADWLADDDEEWTEGGCADMSGLLADYAKTRGIPVRVVTGWASRKTNAKNGFPHAWLEVDGMRFDPSAYVNKIPIKTWVEDESIGRLAVDGSYLDPDGFVRENNSFRLDALLETM